MQNGASTENKRSATKGTGGAHLASPTCLLHLLVWFFFHAIKKRFLFIYFHVRACSLKEIVLRMANAKFKTLQDGETSVFLWELETFSVFGMRDRAFQ